MAFITSSAQNLTSTLQVRHALAGIPNTTGTRASADPLEDYPSLPRSIRIDLTASDITYHILVIMASFLAITS
jgi:hypothetical protein